MIVTPDNRFFFITNEFSGITMYKITHEGCCRVPYDNGSEFIRHDCSIITNDSKYLILACESRMLGANLHKFKILDHGLELVTKIPQAHKWKVRTLSLSQENLY